MQNLADFPEMFTTRRLELRTLAATAENAEMIFRAMDASRDYIAAFQGFIDYVKSPADVLTLLNKRAEQRVAGEAVCFAIFHDGEFIGRIRFKRTGPAAGYFGYWLTAAAAGHGFMSEALQTLERALFDFGFSTLILEIDDGNVRSENIARRNGYVLRERRPMASWSNATGDCDELVYVKTK